MAIKQINLIPQSYIGTDYRSSLDATIAQFIAQQQAKVDKRYLSAWGEVVPFGRGYVWRWHQGGLPGMLAAIHQCKTVSLTADAAWVQFAAVVRAAVGGKSRTAAGERER